MEECLEYVYIHSKYRKNKVFQARDNQAFTQPKKGERSDKQQPLFDEQLQSQRLCAI